MTELASRILASKSGLTRVVDRMKSAGLVRRERPPETGAWSTSSSRPPDSRHFTPHESSTTEGSRNTSRNTSPQANSRHSQRHSRTFAGTSAHYAPAESAANTQQPDQPEQAAAGLTNASGKQTCPPPRAPPGSTKAGLDQPRPPVALLASGHRRTLGPGWDAIVPARRGRDTWFPLIASMWQSEMSERPPSARDGHLGHPSRSVASRWRAVRRAKRARRPAGASGGQRPVTIGHQRRDVAVLAHFVPSSGARRPAAAPKP
jgi:hypothetical protein